MSGLTYNPVEFNYKDLNSFESNETLGQLEVDKTLSPIEIGAKIASSGPDYIETMAEFVQDMEIELNGAKDLHKESIEVAEQIKNDVVIASQKPLHVESPILDEHPEIIEEYPAVKLGLLTPARYLDKATGKTIDLFLVPTTFGREIAQQIQAA